MQKTIIEYLTYREELEMAVLYLNLEKLKYLVAMDIFDEDCLLSNDINETNSAVIAHIFEVVPKIAAAEGLTNGYRIVNCCGEDGGQTVYHLHFHLLGGKKLGENF